MFNFNEEVEEETLETPEEETVEEVVEEEETEEEEVDWKAVAKKNEELANNYKIRAEKAEKKPKAPPVITNGLSTADIIALTRANINDEDVDEVLEYASLKKIPVAQALKTDIIQATLALKEEKRKSASAIHTGNTRRASSGKSDDRMMEDARNGKLPESEADIARLTELRLKNKYK